MELVVKVFIGPKCSMCDKIQPELNGLVKSYYDVGYEVINAVEEVEETEKYGVEVFPTVFFEKNGIVVAKISGLQLMSLYKDVIERWK